jgi:hypothetical protein
MSEFWTRSELAAFLRGERRRLKLELCAIWEADGQIIHTFFSSLKPWIHGLTRRQTGFLDVTLTEI